MAANGISTLTIASGTTLTKNANPPHSNTEIVAPFSAIWSVNYTGALGATNSVSYKLYVTSLGIGSALTLTSHYGDFSVTAGNFLYDSYGTSLGIIKGNATIDNYMAKAAAVSGSLSNSIITAATYKGTWNAFSDTPTLTDGVGTLGDAYDVDTAGTSGAYPAYAQQDWRIYDGAAWQRVDKTTTTEWTIKPATGGLADKESRQTAKLAIAEAKRQGKTVATDGTITGAVDSTKPYYRARDTYDLTQLPTLYDDNTVVDNANTGGLVVGRPWVSYSVAPRANSVDEGSGLGTVFDITTINVANGTTLYFTVTGSVAGADFVSSSLPSGSFTITSNAGTVSFDLKADLLTEGPENYSLQIRTGSTSGRVVETSSLVTVNDTSLTPTITPAANSVNEGSSLSFTVTNLGPNGTYYYTINHVTTANADFSAVSGSFSLTGGGAQDNGTGSFTITTIADTTTEGAQTFTVSVRSGSISGTVIVTSGSITVNDTSLTPAPAPVTQDLILFFDSERTDCYPGTGTTIYNLVDNTPSTLFGNVTYSTGILRIHNEDTANAGNRLAGIQCQTVTGFRTISVWYKQITSSEGYFSYIIDARTGMTGGWIYDTPYGDYFGEGWADGSMFINGGQTQSPTYTQQLNVWRNVTFVTNSIAYTDDITLFSRFTQSEGLDVEFGACMIYNRAISEAENTQNYNQFKTRYGL